MCAARYYLKSGKSDKNENEQHAKRLSMALFSKSELCISAGGGF